VLGKEDLGVNRLYQERQRLVVEANEENIDHADSCSITRTSNAELTERDQGAKISSLAKETSWRRAL
jgi:hypothetical protein